MNLFEILEWSNWKTISKEAKIQAIQQVLMYFVNPLKEISHLELVNFELGGVKCETFEFEIDGDPFVFIPGNPEAILGWDLGVSGLPTNSWDQHHPKEVGYKIKSLLEDYGLNTIDEWNHFINLHTSELRKVNVPPMIVEKFPLPAGCRFIGMLNTITGEFTGNMEQFASLESQVRGKLLGDADPFAATPENILESDQFYLELNPGTDEYYVFNHQECTQTTLRDTIQNDGFDLLNENQWEFAVGAGTRRLFRWGTALDNDDSYYGRQVKISMSQPNMFGLVVDPSETRYEITDDPILKLDRWEQGGIPLLDYLPLATYYRSRRLLTPEETLSPLEFMYRRGIIIELD